MSAENSVLEGHHQPNASVHLDAVRGLAAIAVFLGHGRSIFLKSGIHAAITGVSAASQPTATTTATVAPPPPPEGAAQEHTNIGHEAVVVFFVLSGYFVGGSVLRATRKGYFSWTKYAFQRLSRLWIALIPALLLGLVLDYAGSHFLRSQQNVYHQGPPEYVAANGFPDAVAALTSRLTPVVFLGNVSFLQGISVPLLGTNASLWSLSYEFWYYLFFPMLVIACLASQRVYLRILAGLAMVAAMRFCGPVISRYFLIWLFGAAVAMFPLLLPSGSRRLITVAVGLLFFITLFLELKYPLDLYRSDLILGVVFSLFMWTILHAQQATVGERYRSTAQGLSKMSYTLYLVHMPCFFFLSALLFPVWRAWPLSQHSLGVLFGMYVAVFAICWLMYFCFERNTDRFRERLEQLSSRRL